MKNILIAGFLVFSIMGCKQRPPQDGVVKTTDDDGMITETHCAEGRRIQQTVIAVDGKKQSDIFYFYFHPLRQNSVEIERAEKESTVQYGPNGEIISQMTRYQTSDTSEAVVIGKSFNDKGKVLLLVDSTGTWIYHNNGQLQFERKKIGANKERQTYYDSLGIKREELEIVNKVRHGKRMMWNEKGKIIVNELYKNGKKIR